MIAPRPCRQMLVPKSRKSAALIALALCSVSSPALATDYYVRATGNDNATGLSDAAAWQTLSKVSARLLQPGDRVFFRKGDTFDGQLVIQTSGTAAAPITFASYGTGARPVLRGTVNQPYPANSTIYGVNRQYITIRDLQITHIGSLVYGITFFLTAGGVYNGITLSRNVITGFDGGGVYLNNESTSAARFNATTIELNRIYALGGPTSTASKGIAQRISVNATASNDPGAAWRSTNTIIRHNSIYDIQADGIVWRNDSGARIIGNFVGRTGLNLRRAYAGIWVKFANNVLIERNESFANTDNGADGQGFDLDLDVDNSIVQYNYSHDNVGGFFLSCADSSEEPSILVNSNNIVRYNVSENDRRQIFNLFCGKAENTLIYNNTIYKVNSADLIHAVNSTNGSTSTVWNNIFALYAGGPGYTATGVTYGYNLFTGHESFRPDPTLIRANPLFTLANGGEPWGYRLAAGSPALVSGIAVANNGGFDYFANAIAAGAPNRGFYAAGAATAGIDVNSAFFRPVSATAGKWLGDRFSYLNDGGTGTSAWTDDSDDAILQWNLTKPKTLTRVRFFQDNAGSYQLAQFRVRYYAAGQWVYLNDWSAANINGWQTYDFPDVANVERVQVHFRPEAGGKIGVNEIEAYTL